MLFSVSHEPSVPYQFLVYRNKWNSTLFPGWRSWDGTHTWISFSNFYPTVKIFSHDPLTQEMDCLLASWRLLFLVIPLVTVVIHLAFVLFLTLFFCLKLPCINENLDIVKHYNTAPSQSICNKTQCLPPSL